MKILFRAEGGEHIGSGHVMRCIALAQALVDSGSEVTFLFCNSPSTLVDRAIREGFESLVIQAKTLNHSLEITTDFLSKRRFDWVILDGYSFTPFYQAAIKDRGAKVLSIDDGTEHEFISDIVLNQNLDAENLSDYSCPDTTKLLLGTDYILLRREFRDAAKRLSYKMDRGTFKLLVSFGGADFKDCSSKLIRILSDSKLSNIESKLVIGPCFADAQRIEALALKSGISIEKSPTSLLSLMEWCDLALVASGSTVWELSVTKTPMVIGSYTENQESIREGLSRRGAAISIGDIPTASDSLIVEVLQEISKDYSARLKLSKAASVICDGMGVERVIEALAA